MANPPPTHGPSAHNMPTANSLARNQRSLSHRPAPRAGRWRRPAPRLASRTYERHRRAQRQDAMPERLPAGLIYSRRRGRPALPVLLRRLRLRRRHDARASSCASARSASSCSRPTTAARFNGGALARAPPAEVRLLDTTITVATDSASSDEVAFWSWVGAARHRPPAALLPLRRRPWCWRSPSWAPRQRGGTTPSTATRRCCPSSCGAAAARDASSPIVLDTNQPPSPC